MPEEVADDKPTEVVKGKGKEETARRSAWFLKIDPVWIVGMHVCVSAPEAINN